MAKVVVDFELKYKEAAFEIEQLNEQIVGLEKQVEKTTETSGEMGNQLDKVTGGAITKFNGLKGTLKGVIGSFKTLRGAVMATGIGALIVAVTNLTAAFQGSEDGQNKFSKIMFVLGTLTGNLVDLMADLGEKLISVFESPLESLENFGKGLEKWVYNIFEGLYELIPKLGESVSLLFEGKFRQAADVAINASAKAALGIENITEKTKEATNALSDFIQEQKNEADAAARVADMRAKADKIERALVVRRSELESEIALLRLKSRQEDQFGAEERKQALIEAQKLEDELLDKQTEYLELRRDAQILENTFSRTNKENADKEAYAIAAVNNQIASRANTARQVQRELNTIQGQVDAAENARLSKLKAEQDAKAAERKAEIEGFRKQQEEISGILKDSIVKNEKLRVSGELLTREKFNEIRKKQILDEQKLDKLTTEQKVQLASNAFGQLSMIFGQESKAGKAAAIAQTTIETYKGATAAYASLAGIPIVGPALGAVAAGAAIAAGVANVKAIQNVGEPVPEAPISAPRFRGESFATQAPSFNVVGASPENQLAQAIGQQERKPLKAFVVSNEVSSAQALDRNIVQGASLG